MEENLTAIELVQDRLLGLFQEMSVLKDDMDYLARTALDLKEAFDDIADDSPIYKSPKLSKRVRYEIPLEEMAMG